jgi:hypothetical protein
MSFPSAERFIATWFDTPLDTFPSGVFDNCPATYFSSTWENCGLDQAGVDNILVSIDTAGQINGSLGFGSGNSAPGPAGLAAKANLIAKGWSIYNV